MKISICEKAIEILNKSNDGNDLDPAELKIVEMAVNGFLNEDGIESFNQLHESVRSGNYHKPYLCGIEHLTRDHEGYIYWKDQEVEHFTFSAMTSEEVQVQSAEVEKRCLHLESIKAEISTNSVIWNWEKYATAV